MCSSTDKIEVIEEKSLQSCIYREVGMVFIRNGLKWWFPDIHSLSQLQKLCPAWQGGISLTGFLLGIHSGTEELPHRGAWECWCHWTPPRAEHPLPRALSGSCPCSLQSHPTHADPLAALQEHIQHESSLALKHWGTHRIQNLQVYAPLSSWGASLMALLPACR